MNPELSIFTFNLGDDVEVRYDDLEGEKHLVVPMVMLTEGVHIGSNGAGFYPADENAKATEAWNHMPLVVYHPEKNGKPVSARQATILNTRKVGVVLNTEHVEEKVGDTTVKKLRAEAWINVKRANSVDKRIIQNIKDKKKTEVSTGLYSTHEVVTGDWNGEKYDFIAREQKPDHLAILPDQVGACSIADGAGLLANTTREPEGTVQTLWRSVEKIVTGNGGLLISNEMSFTAISRTLADLLSSKFGEPGKYWNGWIQEIFTDRVIFYDKDKLYSMSYSTTDSGVSLSGEAVEVRRVTSYVTVDGKKSFVSNGAGDLTPNPDPKEDRSMFEKTVHINGLISNGIFTEADRDWLNTQPDDVLKRMKIPTPVAPPPAPAQQVVNGIVTNSTPPAPPAQPTPQTVEQYIKTLPGPVQVVLNRGLAADNATKLQLIEKITKNADGTPRPNCQFSPEYLAGQDTDFLQRVAMLIPDEQTTNGAAPGYGGSPYGPAIGGFLGNSVPHPMWNNAPIDEEPLPTSQPLTFNAPAK